MKPIEICSIALNKQNTRADRRCFSPADEWAPRSSVQTVSVGFGKSGRGSDGTAPPHPAETSPTFDSLRLRCRRFFLSSSFPLLQASPLLSTLPFPSTTLRRHK